MRLALAWLAALAVSASCRPRAADSGGATTSVRTKPPSYDVVRVGAGQIAADGVLHADEWGAIAWTAPFVAPGDASVRPDSPVASRAKLAWSPEGLFVAVEVLDASPTSPHTRDAEDPHIWESASGVELMLQPGWRSDNRHYVELQVDVAGAVWDTHFDDYNAPIRGEGAARRFGHEAWSAELVRGVQVEAGRAYTVEFVLPWSAVPLTDEVRCPPAVGDRWRANLYSFRDGQRQALAWSPILGQGNFHFAPRFGHLRFVDVAR